MNPAIHILNLGAGVQSTTLYLMFRRGELQPAIDCAIFADTQEEPAEVYRHLDWLESLGGPRIIRTTAGKLGDDLMHGTNTAARRFASIPAFVGHDGAAVPRQCSKEYKTAIIARTIRRDVLGLGPRQRVPKAQPIVQYFGISMDEARRARSIRERFAESQKWATPVFPLLDKFMTRADCLTWLATYGGVPHQTPRSACVFCPYHTDAAWQHLKDSSPEGWARAIEVDAALRASSMAMNKGLRHVLYVHRSCVPLADVVLDPKPRDVQMGLSFYQECEGVCGV
jgi:hypothetical protein